MSAVAPARPRADLADDMDPGSADAAASRTTSPAAAARAIPGAALGRTVSRSSARSAQSASGRSPGTSPVDRPLSPAVAAGAGSASGPSKVRAAAAMWETKPAPSGLAPARPALGGRKRSGTTVARPHLAGAGGAAGGGAGAGAAAALASRYDAGRVSPVAARSLTGTSPSSPFSPPSSLAPISNNLEASPPAPASGLRTLTLGGDTAAVAAAAAAPAPSSSARAGTSPSATLTTPTTPPLPSAASLAPETADDDETPTRRSFAHSPLLGADQPATPERRPSASSILSTSTQSVYEETMSAAPGSPSPPRSLDGADADADDPAALGLDLQSVSLEDDTKLAPEPEAADLDLSPVPLELEADPMDAVPLDSPPATTHNVNEAKLNTIDLNAPAAAASAPAHLADTPPRGSSLERTLVTGTTRAAGEPETIVTPASPVSAAPYGGPELAPVSPPASASGTPPRSATVNLSDVPLTPLPAKAAAAPVSPGPTRMASLFKSVLDYGKPAAAALAPTTPDAQANSQPQEARDPPTPDEKRLPEPPARTTSNSKQAAPTTPAMSSFFSAASASAASTFSFLPSIPLRTPSATDTNAGDSNAMGNTNTTNSAGSASTHSTLEPKPAMTTASTWRATMTNFLQSRTNSTVSVSHGGGGAVSSSSSSSSTNLLLHRLDDPTSVRDRRISREYGGGERLREGFDRVRNEMEGAARDIRRDLATGAADREHPGASHSAIDWAFWGSVVQDYEAVARERPKDLSKAIQQGIPPVIRGPIWQLMSSSKSTELEETFKALLKLTSPHEKAIHKDISRTFPNHKFFKNTGQGQDGLFMVVKAYSLYDREVGYTQGLAFIVAALLLNMPDEEAFCVLVRLMDSYNLRSHYLADMPGLQLRLYQFDRLLEDVLPLLHTHLVRKGVKSSMYASQWLMTLFSYRFPLPLVYRVFDIVLAEGIEATFRFALALLHRSEETLLRLGFEQILAVLQGDLFETYRAPPGGETPRPDAEGSVDEDDSEWLSNDFVRDAYAIHITPLMLDQYEAEWEEKCRAQSEHARELDTLRHANRHLSAQVKTLESSLAAINQEHVELVRQLVLAKIAKEDMEAELVRYKGLCAALSQQVAGDEEGTHGHGAGSGPLAPASGGSRAGSRGGSRAGSQHSALGLYRTGSGGSSGRISPAALETRM